MIAVVDGFQAFPNTQIVALLNTVQQLRWQVETDRIRYAQSKLTPAENRVADSTEALSDAQTAQTSAQTASPKGSHNKEKGAVAKAQDSLTTAQNDQNDVQSVVTLAQAIEQQFDTFMQAIIASPAGGGLPPLGQAALRECLHRTVASPDVTSNPTITTVPAAVPDPPNPTTKTEEAPEPLTGPIGESDSNIYADASTSFPTTDPDQNLDPDKELNPTSIPDTAGLVTHVLYVAVSSSGGESQIRKRLFFSPVIRYVGACTISFILAKTDGDVIKADAVTMMGEVLYKLNTGGVGKLGDVKITSSRNWK
jgi:cellobiose-specific phosphotransferase system component IIA